MDPEDLMINGIIHCTTAGYTVGAVRVGKRYVTTNFNEAVIEPIFGKKKESVNNGKQSRFIEDSDLIIDGVVRCDTLGYTVGAFRAAKRRFRGSPTPK